MNKTRLILLSVAIYTLTGCVFGQTPVAASTKGYLIGPGDVLSIKALGEKDFDVDGVTVDDDGKIEIPFVPEPIAAGCKTERELTADIAKQWSKFLKNPQIALRVTARNSRPPVNVTGEVANRAQFALTRRTSLLEVLSAAGGATTKSSGMVQVVRTRPPICGSPDAIEDWKRESEGLGVATRLYSLSAVARGTPESNPEILPGDIVNVPEAAKVYITGEVKKPGPLDLPAGGLPLSQAIAMSYGNTNEAKVKEIKIYRHKPGTTEPEVLVANLETIKAGTSKDVMLEPYDIVEVGKAKKSFGQVLQEALISLPNRIPIPIP